MTWAQIQADLWELYAPYRISPWLVLANGNAVCLIEDPRLATSATPPATIEVLWLDPPAVTDAWPYPPLAGCIYPGTYPCVDPQVVRRYMEECGGVVGLVDAAQSPSEVRADVRAHQLSERSE